jgi:hypothetical protein
MTPVFTTKMACVAFAMLQSLPPWYEDVSEEGRDQRLAIVAAAEAAGVAAAGQRVCDDSSRWCSPVWGQDPVVLIAGVTAEGWWETKFAKHVHEGACRAWECDAWKRKDGTVLHRARNVWQVQGWAAGWNQMLGATPEATTTAAVAAARLLAVGWNSCGGNHLGAVTRYAGLGGCSWKGGQGRVKTWLELVKVGRAAAAACDEFAPR